MKADKLFHEIEENGGLNIEMLRKMYKYDVARSGYKKSFRAWLTGWVRKNYAVSCYVARKVSECYNL